MYQNTLSKQKAKNVYDHLHKDSQKRELDMHERRWQQVQRLEQLKNHKGKKPIPKSDSIMGQRLVDEFLSGMQNLFKDEASESKETTEEYMQKLMLNELSFKQLAFILYDLGFTEFSPDLLNLHDIARQKDILAVYRLLTTYAD